MADKHSLFDDGVVLDLSIGFWTALARNQAPDLGIKKTLPGMSSGWA